MDFFSKFISFQKYTHYDNVSMSFLIVYSNQLETFDNFDFVQKENRYFYYGTGASDRSFYPIFNKKFDHLETLLTIQIPKKEFVSWVTLRPLVPSPQPKYTKGTFILPHKYHASVANMLS